MNLGDSTRGGEHAFENCPAIYPALMFNLAPPGNLAAEVALESPFWQHVDARLILGAALGYHMHTHSLHSPGRS